MGKVLSINFAPQLSEKTQLEVIGYSLFVNGRHINRHSIFLPGVSYHSDGFFPETNN